MSVVRRFDNGRLGKVERTPSGGIRVPANLTRTGIFIYRKADGETVRELRPPEEVFHKDSLATLAGAPVTDLHPQVPVTPANWKQVTVGHVGDQVKQDGRFVAAKLAIQDRDAIMKIDNNEREELSCGYSCRMDETPGTYNGERYDAVQRNIRYNHVAIGPRDWGRAGNDVSLRLDSGDAVQVNTDKSAVTPPEKNKQKETPPMKIIRIDGRDVEYGSEDHIRLIESKADDRVAAANKERDEIQGKHDALVKERDELQAKYDADTDPKRLDELARERADLLANAHSVLGKDAKLDGKSDRDIMLEVIRKDSSEFDAEGKSDDYVKAYFEATAKRARKADAGGRGIAAVRDAAVGARRNDGFERQDADDDADDDSVGAARRRMRKDNAEAHTKPLRFSREA